MSVAIFFAVLAAHVFVGGIVWAAIDDQNKTLLAWYRSCPQRIAFWAQPLVLIAWPVALFLWCFSKWRTK